MTLGEKLRAARLKWKMKQEDVADYLGIGFPMISQYESGAKTPNLSRLMQLAELYGVSIDELVAP
jgi:transcriptional regulator with XRE-family HTH domain